MTTVHVYPVQDQIEHDLESDDCICGPAMEAVFRNDGSNGWVITHHSLDGRERWERGREDSEASPECRPPAGWRIVIA